MKLLQLVSAAELEEKYDALPIQAFSSVRASTFRILLVFDFDLADHCYCAGSSTNRTMSKANSPATIWRCQLGSRYGLWGIYGDLLSVVWVVTIEISQHQIQLWRPPMRNWVVSCRYYEDQETLNGWLEENKNNERFRDRNLLRPCDISSECNQLTKVKRARGEYTKLGQCRGCGVEYSLSQSSQRGRTRQWPRQRSSSIMRP